MGVGVWGRLPRAVVGAEAGKKLKLNPSVNPKARRNRTLNARLFPVRSREAAPTQENEGAPMRLMRALPPRHRFPTQPFPDTCATHLTGICCAFWNLRAPQKGRIYRRECPFRAFSTTFRTRSKLSGPSVPERVPTASGKVSPRDVRNCWRKLPQQTRTTCGHKSKHPHGGTPTAVVDGGATIPAIAPMVAPPHRGEADWCDLFFGDRAKPAPGSRTHPPRRPF